MWTTELTLKLIEDLQINDCLWDVTSVNYRNRDKRAKTICELAQKYDVASSEIDKKIHTLKSQFRREHKKLVEARKSGASPKKCAWFGYDHLLFLLPANESRGSRSTDEEKVSNKSYNSMYFKLCTKKRKLIKIVDSNHFILPRH